MEDVLENKKYVYKYNKENSYIDMQRNETFRSNKSGNMDETEKDINETNSIYIENLQDENNNINFYDNNNINFYDNNNNNFYDNNNNNFYDNNNNNFYDNNIEAIKQANGEIQEKYQANNKYNNGNNKTPFAHHTNVSINNKGDHFYEIDNKIALQKQTAQHTNHNVGNHNVGNASDGNCNVLLLNDKSNFERNEKFLNFEKSQKLPNFEKNEKLPNFEIKENEVIYNSNKTNESNNLYSPYYNTEEKEKKQNSIGIYQLNYVNNINNVQFLNSANSTNCTSNNNNANGKNELIYKNSLKKLNENKAHIYNNIMDTQHNNNFYEQNKFNISSMQNNNRKRAWIAQNENGQNYLYHNKETYENNVNNRYNEFGGHIHLYDNTEGNSGKNNEENLCNYYKKNDRNEQNEQNERKCGRYYEESKTPLVSHAYIYGENSEQLIKDYNLKIMNKKIRNVSPLHHRAYSNISHKKETKNKIISNIKREHLFSDQTGSNIKYQYNNSPYQKKIKGNKNISLSEIEQKKNINEINKFLNIVNYYENDKNKIKDSEDVSVNLDLVKTFSPNFDKNSTKLSENNYTDKLNKWNDNNKISYNELGKLENYTKCKMMNSYENSELENFEKRTSFSYSGILTSMISSILTQQNDRKIEKNNCLYNNFRGNNNISKNKENYEYNLLYNIKDGEEIKNKYIFSKKVSNKINLKNKKNNNILLLTLTLMIGLSVLCNFDHGAIPVTLEEIQKDFPLSYIEQSLLGSLVYCGLIFGTIIASILFELISAKWLVTISIILLSISLYIFSNANGIIVMYISRFVNGLCQAIPVVYLPVWVDIFSPEEKATQWMSYIQLASIGGTVFGYFLGGILSNNYNQNNILFNNMSFVTTWRSPFLMQAFLLLPIFLIMIFIPSSMINISSKYSDIETEEIENNNKINEKEFGNSNFDNLGMDEYNEMTLNSQSNILTNLNKKKKYILPYQNQQNNINRKNYNRSATYIMEQKTNILRKTFKEVKKLLNNKLYIIITLGMSNLYFVVTGIQFWITEYMSVVLLTEKMKIVTVSTLCFLTSPTSGVWFGGFICDLFGGYKNTNYSKTIKVATAFAISACIFGILSAHLTNFIFFSISLWLCLFTGSALVPVAVGMLLSCVSNHQKSLSSAVSQVIYNVFGWFSAPLLSGIIMDIMHKYTNNNRLALKAGFTMILYSSCIGFFLLLYANFLDFSDKKGNEESHELEEPLM
ncbi:uncharacterized protein PY17X_0820300 [Plasmodium yoelii]|nr:uncharacterized protein PY17X_0820300 [Plasmodium yoelii]CDU17562.1 sugar transporter, putative [Plasmodium yoelii]VTZ77402.1 major facilitator superfamily domain-containing protein, putative [Plasmodium yoelii]|eukprot:XP_727951.2 uncharacterized protein PY17X_0820300 [Plasmodium yoelii]